MGLHSDTPLLPGPTSVEFATTNHHTLSQTKGMFSCDGLCAEDGQIAGVFIEH
jgi:hypothetical protein